MNYHIGDQVVHWNYGPGVITQLDEKVLSGQSRLYYVVEVTNSTLWVPVDEAGEKSLRLPTPEDDFIGLLGIFNGPAENLPENQYERQSVLSQRLKNRTLFDVCTIIRDLSHMSLSHKLNRSDADLLKRAEEFLLTEWSLSLGITREVAQANLQNLLKEAQQKAVEE